MDQAGFIELLTDPQNKRNKAHYTGCRKINRKCIIKTPPRFRVAAIRNSRMLINNKQDPEGYKKSQPEYDQA